MARLVPILEAAAVALVFAGLAVSLGGLSIFLLRVLGLRSTRASRAWRRWTGRDEYVTPRPAQHTTNG